MHIAWPEHHTEKNHFWFDEEFNYIIVKEINRYPKEKLTKRLAAINFSEWLALGFNMPIMSISANLAWI
jgi:hypothetical protein